MKKGGANIITTIRVVYSPGDGVTTAARPDLHYQSAECKNRMIQVRCTTFPAKQENNNPRFPRRGGNGAKISGMA